MCSKLSIVVNTLLNFTEFDMKKIDFITTQVPISIIISLFLMMLLSTSRAMQEQCTLQHRSPDDYGFHTQKHLLFSFIYIFFS